MRSIRLAALASAAALFLALLPAGPAAAASKCFGKTPTIVGTSGDDRLRGTPGRDVIQAAEATTPSPAAEGRTSCAVMPVTIASRVEPAATRSAAASTTTD